MTRFAGMVKGYLKGLRASGMGRFAKRASGGRVARANPDAGRVTRIARCVAVPLALVALLAPAALCAATVAEIAQDKSPNRQEMLEAGARREGALMLYATGTQIQPLIDAFSKLYPYIKVSMPRASSEDVTRKVVEEYSAGLFQVDAFELSSFGLVPLREQGVLQPFVSPHQVNYPATAIGPDGAWTSVRESYIGVGYNTTKITKDAAPRSYDDLLDPKWKNRMAVSGSDSSLSNMIGAMILAKGESFVRKLAMQNSRVYQVTGRALANLTISGEAPLALTIYSAHVEASKAEGAPIEWVAPGLVSVTDTAAAIAARAPHPHAAMLFIDFLLTKDAQLMYRALGYKSAHKDVASISDAGLEKVYLANRPNYVREFESWSRLTQDLFFKAKR